jgi:fructokinase
MLARFPVVGIGEALFDVLPDGEVLGGAPLNVAIHAHQLLAAKRGQGIVVARIGQDTLGRDLLDQLRERGINISHIQSDPDRDTGRVFVDLDSDGSPTYDIVENVAWDWLYYEADLQDLATQAAAVAFGTLAQRNAETRNTIYRFLDDARAAIKLFDVNLRQTYYSQSILARSCELATILKCNADELAVVAEQLGLIDEQVGEAAHETWARQLRKKYGLKLVVVTHGEQGGIAYDDQGVHRGEAASYPMAGNADAVGAGDAYSAGLLTGMLLKWPLERTLTLANHVGAYLASQRGATPTLPDAILGLVAGK